MVNASASARWDEVTTDPHTEGWWRCHAIPVLAVASLLVVPIAYLLYQSVSRAAPGAPDDTGISLLAYESLFVDPDFYRALGRTFLYSLLTIIPQLVIGTVCAAVVHRLRTGVGLFASIAFLPYAIPPITAVIAWKFLLGDRGTLAQFASVAVGIAPEWWLGGGTFWTLVVVSIWEFYPFVFVAVLARLRRIPEPLYRQAEADGAGPLQQFVWVTLPHLRRTLLTVAILRFIFMFTKFDTPWLLGGSSNTALSTLPLYIFDKNGSNVGLATAVTVAVALAGVLVVLWREEAVKRPRLGRSSPLLLDLARLADSHALGRTRHFCFVALLTSMSLFALVPLAALAAGSLLPDTLTDSGLALWMLSDVTAANHWAFLTERYGLYLTWLKNTAIVSAGAVAIVGAVALLGAYGITRYDSVLRIHLRRAALFGYALPAVVSVFAFLPILTSLGLTGSYLGLILANASFCLPFGLWLMVDYFEATPLKWDRIAVLDGAGWFRTLRVVSSHAALPGIVAVCVFTFVLVWNDALFSLVLGTRDTYNLVTGSYVTIFQNPTQVEYSSFAAASLWVACPPAIAFVAAHAFVDRRIRAQSAGR